MIQAAQLLSLPGAGRLLPGRPHATAVWGMCRRGILGRNGVRVYLSHSRVGRKIYTSEEAIGSFQADLDAADRAYFDQRRQGTPTVRKHERLARPTDRERAIQEAEARLAVAGI